LVEREESAAVHEQRLACLDRCLQALKPEQRELQHDRELVQRHPDVPEPVAVRHEWPDTVRAIGSDILTREKAVALKLPAGLPTDYPSDLEESVILPGRLTVRIRALRRGEEGLIRELYAHLSPHTRYLRFLSPMPTLPDAVLRLLAAVDYRRRLALVAEHNSAGGPEIVGLGSFGAVDD